MRIAHLIWDLGLGGAELVVLDLVNRQAELADIGLVVVNDLVDARLMEKLSPRVRAIELHRRPGSRDPRPLFRLSRALRAFAPDVIHSHHVSLIKLLVPLLLPAKKVLTLHNTFDPVGPTTVWYDRVFAVSEAVRQYIVASASRIHPLVVHNGVDCLSIKTRKDGAGRGLRIVHVARLEHEVKGQDVLIDALAAVRRKHPSAPVSVDFVGEGPSLEYLQNKVVSLELDGKVRFLGSIERERVYNMLCEYDLLVNPSRTEGFGLTIAEGMAARVPVLVSDLPGPMEVIRSGAYGDSFACGDAENCAARILNILERKNCPESRLRCERAFLYATEAFEIQRTVAAYLREYTRLLTPRNRRDPRPGGASDPDENGTDGAVDERVFRSV